MDETPPVIEFRQFQRGTTSIIFLDSRDPVPEDYQNFICNVPPTPTGLRDPQSGQEFTINGQFSFHADGIDEAFDIADRDLPIRKTQMIDEFRTKLTSAKLLTPAMIAAAQNNGQNNGQHNRMKFPA